MKNEAFCPLQHWVFNTPCALLIPTMTLAAVRAEVCMFWTPSLTHSFSSSQRQCQHSRTLKQRMTLAQTFLDRDLQQEQGQGHSSEVTKGGQSRREGEWELPLVNPKGLFWLHNRRSPGAPKNSWWKSVETLMGIKGVPEVSQLEK